MVSFQSSLIKLWMGRLSMYISTYSEMHPGFLLILFLYVWVVKGKKKACNTLVLCMLNPIFGIHVWVILHCQTLHSPNQLQPLISLPHEKESHFLLVILMLPCCQSCAMMSLRVNEVQSEGTVYAKVGVICSWWNSHITKSDWLYDKTNREKEDVQYF